MRYNITGEFVKLSESDGTIQNISCINAVEVSDKPQVDTGILLAPLQKISFSGQTLYVRCAANGGATVSVVPFEIDLKGGGGSSTIIVEGGELPIATNADIDNLLDDIFGGN